MKRRRRLVDLTGTVERKAIQMGLTADLAELDERVV